MTDTAIISAYASPSLQGIKGDLRTPSGVVLAESGTPGEAFEALLAWIGSTQ